MTDQIRRISVGLVAMVVLLAALAMPSSVPVVAQSNDNARYAAVVIDATTGEPLFSRHGEARRFPASLTKMMTLYLTFEALAEGRVSLDDEVLVSPLAAAQPPSKLGLSAGQRIRLDDAMRATAIRSANDMALAIAEHIGGSQARFAGMMTEKAQRLGMSSTRYVNPHGLTDSRQVTSANDQAILSRALMRDFPQYYNYFSQNDWAYQGRGYRNTNGLLSSGMGYDGIKTGFTSASGYNLAASAVRDGRRLIVVVLGGRSSASRNGHVAELMNTGFELENRRAGGERLQIAQSFFESRGFGINARPPGDGPVAYATLSAEADEAGAVGSPGPAPTTIRPRVPSPIHVAGTDIIERPAARSSPNVTASLNGAPAAPRQRAPSTSPARAPAGNWSVQVGAFKDEGVARNWLGEINRRFRSQFAGAERSVQTAGEWYRSRFTGLTEETARSACSTLAARRVTCAVIRPD
jgi:D-alanyl-D-alanine carboxypeptidase (penicillin-binding protein 5/6)